ncbi:hypothetical protein D3C76_1371290 [compost metagenome]
MITYLTHYYRQGDPPFRSLSALCDAEAIAVMESLYEDNPLADRFKEPAQYMNNRRQVEHWVKNEFIAKGGEPKENYPLYAVLGYSHWMEENLTFLELSSLRVPLTISAHYQSQYHGKIFTVILG